MNLVISDGVTAAKPCQHVEFWGFRCLRGRPAGVRCSSQSTSRDPTFYAFVQPWIRLQICNLISPDRNVFSRRPIHNPQNKLQGGIEGQTVSVDRSRLLAYPGHFWGFSPLDIWPLRCDHPIAKLASLEDCLRIFNGLPSLAFLMSYFRRIPIQRLLPNPNNVFTGQKTPRHLPFVSLSISLKVLSCYGPGGNSIPHLDAFVRNICSHARDPVAAYQS